MHLSRLTRAGLAGVLTMLLACSADVDAEDGALESEGPTNVIQSLVTSPAISATSVTSGIAGTSVTVTGTNFGDSRGASNVYFRGNAAPIVSWSNTQIVCTVPASATAGSLSLWVRVSAVDSSAVPFTIIPSIASAAPSIVAPGAQVTIDGANFGTTQQPGATVKIGGTTANIQSWSMRKIVVLVPPSASGDLAVVVTVNGQSSSAATITTNTPAPPPSNNHVDGREVLYSWMDTGTNSLADKINGDVWPAERFSDATLAWPLTWTENPYNDAYWRMQFYSFRSLRHTLAAYRATGNAAYLSKLMAVIRSFSDSGQGSSYARDRFTTAMRGLFLVNTYWKLKKLNVLSGADDTMLVTLIDTTGRFLADPANYDAGNSNGLTEAAALLAIAVNFPSLSDASSWSSLAQGRLTSYMSSAVDADGVVREKSPHQQYQLLSQVWEIARWANTHAAATGAALASSITAMSGPAAHLMQPDGKIPLAGASPSRTVRGVSLFDEVAQSQSGFSWSLSRGTAGVKPNKRMDLTSTGWTTLRSGWDNGAFDQETQVFFDWRRSSHSSNDRDLLNVLVYAEGRQVIVDSGMYSSEGTSPWGSYFRSTAAHNTIVVDGASQPFGAAQAGTISDLTDASKDGRDTWARSARHAAYPGVLHSRQVAMLDRNIIVVIDHLKSATSHTYEQVWHLTPDVTQVASSAAAGGAAVVGRAGNGTDIVRLVSSHSILNSYELTPQVATARGVASPAAGWTSDSSGTMQANYDVRFSAQGTEVVFATLITTGALASDATASWGYAWNTGAAWGERGAGGYVSVPSLNINREVVMINAGEADEYSAIVDAN